ncbi:MAG TPA: bifunctional phosphoribosylaminoimidazolecarboxamide formyltransferase/IMP cyclohydrolase [Pyrinomonadaceae bacterium]|nr:bifunctional phosphoribosylaminoimidazolecarboxamide formyltransferase/IMP cyclohydrolase [Pyrinomonadaceae bacterium]
MSELRKIRRALISVSDKTGIVEFARALAEFGVEIISTGGTARTLREAGLDVTDVSKVTGFPEMMDGRVKTLHPKIHGGFLAVRDNPEHVESMNQHGIQPIDMVVVNLYPFEQTIAREGVSLEEAVENIDIGGPAMIRSASKNWRDVAVLTDARQYDAILDELKTNDASLSLETRQRLATEAYTRTATYDLAISNYLLTRLAGADDFPSSASFNLRKLVDLRYGENPHQKAALYGRSSGGIANARQLHGKEMSYNNYVDAEAAWNLVQDLDELAVAIIKHTNPSGVGTGASNEEAYRRALAADPVSAFGGIVAFNHPVDAQVAKSVNEVFTEVVLSPSFTSEALEVFKTKKNLRVLEVSAADGSHLEFKQISGGFLAQDRDTHRLRGSDLQVVTKRGPSADEIRALLFAWTVCKHVKSNAIVFAQENQTLGVGAGQMNRVDSVRIAAMRAERFDLPLNGSVLASDAFFPFRDNIDEAAKYGVSAIIQPGGSVRDEECIAAADENAISMVFTGIRHFKH